MKTMKATVFHGANDIRLEEIDRPRPGIGEAEKAIEALARMVVTETTRLFHTVPVRAEAWLYLFATGVAAYAVVEFEKWMRFGRHRTGHAVSE